MAKGWWQEIMEQANTPFNSWVWVSCLVIWAIVLLLVPIVAALLAWSR